MEKDQIIILEDMGLVSVTGDDAKEYLQNIDKGIQQLRSQAKKK